MKRRSFAVIGAHIVFWFVSFMLAFELRFDFHWRKTTLAMLVWLPLLLAARLVAFQATGLFRRVWRYSGVSDLIAIVIATTLSSAAFMLGIVAGLGPILRSIPIIEWLCAIGLVGGARLAARAIRVVPRPRVNGPSGRLRILIAGAGDAGEMLLREIEKTYRARYEVIGFLDDDPAKRGSKIHGVDILGPIDLLPREVAKLGADEVLIAVPSASGAQMRRIVDLCRTSGARFRTMPGIGELIDGRLTVGQLRDVAIEDLLGREPVQLDGEAIRAAMAGQVVMVSGAGGSIGSEICRQLCRFSPSRLVLVERAERNLFEIHRELSATFPELEVVPCIADVTDRPRMKRLFEGHRPHVLFHAAAHKHVPMMEWNPGEAVKNNVFGTKNLADLADAYGVRRFVMISTDKAVNPASIMGTSKRVAEIYVQALSQRSWTKFVTVRFGNVLGSTGSVVPIFQDQISRGGPVTVTHPEMKRYFMTIPEASQLVLQAGAMGEGGEIFILDMGQPVKIADLARDLITLSGLRPGVDVEIKFTGVRPGEKLCEELSVADESATRTRHPKIFVGHLRPHSWDDLQRRLRDLEVVVDGKASRIRKRLADCVPEFTPSPKPTPVPLPSSSEVRFAAAND